MKNIENMTIKELKQNGFELDETIRHAIYDDPKVRDLPRMAGLYGFFARFIVAQSDIYFVFGMRQEVVFGEFVEARETIVPLSVVEKCGYFNPDIDASNLICPSCTVIKMPCEIDGIYFSMQLVETLCWAYKKYNLDIPEYISVESDSEAVLRAFRDVASNPEIINNHAKFSFQMRQKQYLLDHAIWEWPIRPDGKKPGLLAFSSNSRYSPHDIDLKRVERLYHSPNKWEQMFRSEECYGNLYPAIFYDKKELDFVCRGLDQMHIPYIRDFIDKKTAKADRAEKQWYLSFFNNQFYENRANTTLLLVSRLDFGALFYWESMFLKTLFTEEECEYGTRLFNDFFDIRTQQYVPAIYVFNCIMFDLSRIKVYAEKKQIPIGFIGIRESDDYGHVTLVVSYEHIPAIINVLHKLHFVNSTFHDVSLTGEFSSESRSYTKDGQGIFISGSPWSGGYNRTWRYPIDSVRGIVKPRK